MYEKEITRCHRTAFIIAIDQSQSMLEEVCLYGKAMPKAEAVAKITDCLITELILRAKRDEKIRDYYDIAVLGYSDDEVYPLIDPKRYFIPVSEFCSYKHSQSSSTIERLLPDGTLRQHTECMVSWIPPKASGNTPMYEAMMQIRDLIAEWCSKPQNADSFPPIIFNITDGICSDCSEDELRSITEQIRGFSTGDGNVLLLNIHLASGSTSRSIIFPSDSDIDPDDHFMHLLADCSSFMPEAFNELILTQRGCWALPPFRAMSYNASLTELITMLCIGSRSITNLS